MSTSCNTAMNRIADYLSTPNPGESNSLEQQLQRTLRAIRTHLGMDVSFVSKLKDGRRLINRIDASYSSGPMIVDASCPMDADIAPSSGAHISVPIRLSDGTIYGTFSCFSNSADPSMTERDATMLRVFADIATEMIAADIEGRQLLTAIENRIQDVLNGNLISMVYQPIHRVPDNRLVGFESLARFSSPPLRSPDQWFNDATQVGLDLQLEYRAIQLALESLHILPPNVFVAVNASPKAIIDEGFKEQLLGWPIDRIVLEVTEHSIIDTYSQVASAIEPLRSLGLRLAIDDVGAGYSSFRHILNLEPNLIKIDMSITRNIHSDSSRRALASALVKFSMETGSVLVAEGVESAEELAVLRNLGIDYVQGYYLAHPMPLSQATDYAQHSRRL